MISLFCTIYELKQTGGLILRSMPSLQLESTKNCNRFGSFPCWSYTPLQCSYLHPHLPQTIVGGQEKPPKSPKSTSLGLLSIRSRSIPSPLWFNWLIFVSLPPGTQPLSCHEFPSTFNPWQNLAILWPPQNSHRNWPLRQVASVSVLPMKPY